MTVMLAPPYTRSGADPAHYADVEALTEGPRYVRTKNMGRWHRPRSGRRYSDGISWDTWCGQLVHGRRKQGAIAVRDTEPVDGLPICGTCEGRAIGAGQDDNDSAHDLIFLPAGVLPPRTCPGASIHTPGLFDPLNARLSVGRCLACGAIDKISGGSRGAYNWSPLRMKAHTPEAALVAPCAFHAWDHLTKTASGVVCRCTVTS